MHTRFVSSADTSGSESDLAANETADGRQYVAVQRLTDVHGRVIADVGETCERVPAAKSGGTVADAFAWLCECGAIRRA